MPGHQELFRTDWLSTRPGVQNCNWLTTRPDVQNCFEHVALNTPGRPEIVDIIDFNTLGRLESFDRLVFNTPGRPEVFDWRATRRDVQICF